MAAVVAGCGKALVSTGWAISLLVQACLESAAFSLNGSGHGRQPVEHD